jgi:hypothetical protein
MAKKINRRPNGPVVRDLSGRVRTVGPLGLGRMCWAVHPGPMALAIRTAGPLGRVRLLGRVRRRIASSIPRVLFI